MLYASSVLERFWKYTLVESGNKCWEWIGSKDQYGYGRLTDGRKARHKAHRISYAIHNGELVKGLEICHQCDNPGCVNPVHLTQETHQANMKQAGNRNCIHKNSIANLFTKKILSQAQIDEIKRIKFCALNGRGVGRRVVDVANEYGVCTHLISAVKNDRY